MLSHPSRSDREQKLAMIPCGVSRLTFCIPSDLMHANPCPLVPKPRETNFEQSRGPRFDFEFLAKYVDELKANPSQLLLRFGT